MSHRRIKVRTAIDTNMELYAEFDLFPMNSKQYDNSVRREAVNLHWFIKNNCSAPFFEAFKSLFNENKGMQTP